MYIKMHDILKYKFNSYNAIILICGNINLLTFSKLRQRIIRFCIICNITLQSLHIYTEILNANEYIKEYIETDKSIFYIQSKTFR